jgi:tetratricopeptide (TPR) repeat protein
MLVRLLIALFFLCSYQAHSQWVMMRTDADSLVKLGANQIYNMQFDSAQSSFGKVIEMYPRHPAGYFLETMVEWWRIQSNRRTKAYDDAFLGKAEKVLALCDELLEINKSDLSALFFKGGALGFRGRFYASRENWLKAADDGRVAFDILQQCQKLAPGNHDIMLGTGIYNYYAAVLPEQYPVLKAVMVFLPRGDRSLGLLQLEVAGRKAKYAAIEAKVSLLQAQYQFEKNPGEALKISQDLLTLYPNNPYFHRYVGRCQVQMGMYPDMEKTWRDIVIRCIDKKTGYDQQTAREGLYYVGLALMNRGKLDSALRYFYKCDEAGRFLDEDVSGFTVKVNLKIGNIYDLQGRRDMAIAQYKKVLAWDERQNSHAEARNFLQTPYR